MCSTIIRIPVYYAKVLDSNQYQGNYVLELSSDIEFYTEGTQLQNFLNLVTIGALGENSHVEGYECIAEGTEGHAEGAACYAKGDDSHAEGVDCIAEGACSHAEGLGTIAKGANQHVQGMYNIVSENDYAFIIGNGTEDSRSDAFGVKWNGDVGGDAIKNAIPSSGDTYKLPNVGAVRTALNQKASLTEVTVRTYTGSSSKVVLSTLFNFYKTCSLQFLIHNDSGDTAMLGQLFEAEETDVILFGSAAGGSTSIPNDATFLFTIYKAIVDLPPEQEGGEARHVVNFLIKKEDAFGVDFVGED